jgi:16S rRNA (cytidine1402-2'-O)-methyltransferase
MDTDQEQETKGILYLCATPIGNLEDITLRVLRILREVDLIAAEDTRHTRKLLSHYDIHTRLTSYHKFNQAKKGEALLELLASGKNIALVSDAGLPGISDPGAGLVAGALEKGLKVVPLPGPSAGITALVASGLPAGEFVFAGFLPAAGKARRQRLADLRSQKGTLIFYEAPHRLRSALADFLAVLGNRPAAAARELTKKHEEIVRGSLQGLLEHFQAKEPRGEFTLVVAGARETPAGCAGCEGGLAEKEPHLALDPAAHVALLEAGGMERKEAIRRAARLRGLTRRDVYGAVVKEKEAKKKRGT